MEPNEPMNRSRHEPQRNRTGTNHFAVHKVIYEPMRIDANHGNPVINMNRTVEILTTYSAITGISVTRSSGNPSCFVASCNHVAWNYISCGFKLSKTFSNFGKMTQKNVNKVKSWENYIFSERWCSSLFAFQALPHLKAFFPECVARVPVSLWGSGGWGCACSRLRLWSQPSATVRNRPYELRMAVPMGSSAEVVIFGGFQCVVASFRVAGVALRDIQTCSATCRKSFCVAGGILLRRFQKMCCSFRGRGSTLDVSIVFCRGRRSTLDVSCCVFFANRIGKAASSGDKVQIPWQAWHFVRCAENWRKPRTKHRFWGCKFSGSKENS